MPYTPYLPQVISTEKRAKISKTYGVRGLLAHCLPTSVTVWCFTSGQVFYLSLEANQQGEGFLKLMEFFVRKESYGKSQGPGLRHARG